MEEEHANYGTNRRCDSYVLKKRLQTVIYCILGQDSINYAIDKRQYRLKPWIERITALSFGRFFHSDRVTQEVRIQKILLTTHAYGVYDACKLTNKRAAGE